MKKIIHLVYCTFHYLYNYNFIWTKLNIRPKIVTDAVFYLCL